MKKYLLVLLLCLLLGMFLRIFMLANRPDGFTWDEAALGYNAYSLLKTGKDEYGKPLPVILKSFGDYKPGLYTYFLVPLTAVGGLNPFTTRLPSAIFGCLGIIIIFLLSKEMFGTKIGLATGLLMAINPWSIQFSRGAWEANVSLVLTLTGTLLFLRKKYIWSVIFFGLTFWTYQGAKLFTPLLVTSLTLIYWRQINFKALIKTSLVGIIFLIPILFGWKTQSGRLNVYSVFSYRRDAQSVKKILTEDGASNFGLTYYLFHSEKLDQLRGIYGRYLNHLSPGFLFITGDWTSLRQTIPYYGYFHIIEMVFIALGLVWVLRNLNPHTRLILVWLFLAPVPAALSRDQVSGVRALPLLIPLVLLSGIGFAHLAQRKVLAILVTGIMVFLVAYYCDLYFIHAPYFSGEDWLYPYQPSVNLVAKNMANYKNIVFTQKLGQPYIFVLYYLKVDPRQYQKQSALTENSQGDVGTIDKFANFEFRNIYWPRDRYLTSTLFVGTQFELPEQDLETVDNLVRVGDINYLNGDSALRIVGIQ